MGYPSSIWIGNDRAHASDFSTYVCLFRNNLILCDDTFTALCCLQRREAGELLGTVIDLYVPPIATTISD